MKSMLHFNQVALAVAGALALTACGGASDSTESAKSAPKHWLTPTPVNTTTTTPAPTPAKPNSDSSNFTSFNPDKDSWDTIENWVNPPTPEPLLKEYYTAKSRNGLHTEIGEAYGQRFETTFRYTAQIADGNSDITGKVYRNSEAIPLEKLGNGHKVYTMKETAETHIDGTKYSGERTSRIQLYQQPNSVVLGRQTLSGNITDGTNAKTLNETPLRIDNLRGNGFAKPSAEATASAASNVKTIKEGIETAKTAKDTAQKAYDDAIAKNKAASGTATSYGSSTTTPTLIDTAPLKAALDKAIADLANIQSQLAPAEAILDRINKAEAVFKQGLEFNYVGEAFNQNSTNANKGKLEYAINFNTRTGHGKITGLDTGTINLNNANMGTLTHTNPDDNITTSGDAVLSSTGIMGIQGVANFVDGRKDGIYTLGIFGESAQEVAGFVTEDNVNTVGFGGVKK